MDSNVISSTLSSYCGVEENGFGKFDGPKIVYSMIAMHHQPSNDVQASPIFYSFLGKFEIDLRY